MLLTERTPDGHPQVWLLYSPEPFTPDSPEEREVNLWVRRANVFTSRDEATAFLSRLLGVNVGFDRYDPIFPEMWIYRYRHSGALEHRWLMCPAPVNPPGRNV